MMTLIIHNKKINYSIEGSNNHTYTLRKSLEPSPNRECPKALVINRLLITTTTYHDIDFIISKAHRSDATGVSGTMKTDNGVSMFVYYFLGPVVVLQHAPDVVVFRNHAVRFILAFN